MTLSDEAPVSVAAVIERAVDRASRPGGGSAVADVLIGLAEPSGRLTRTQSAVPSAR